MYIRGAFISIFLVEINIDKMISRTKNYQNHTCFFLLFYCNVCNLHLKCMIFMSLVQKYFALRKYNIQVITIKIENIDKIYRGLKKC